MTFRRQVARVRALFGRRRMDRELACEIAAHLELAERDARAAGLSPERARRAARRRFGGVELIKELHRDQRGVRWIDTFARDVSSGARALTREPGFACIAIAVLALGIGGNAAMFSLVDAVLLKPLPFPAPERMVRIWETPRPESINVTNTLDFEDWKHLATTFEALSAVSSASVALTGQGEPTRLPVGLVSADYFRVFGVQPQRGRSFRPEEDQPGADPVVVLSHATWQGRFGGDPAILGRVLVLDGAPHEVVGVLPPGVFDQDAAQMWIPLVFSPAQRNRGFHWLEVIGRMKPGVDLRRAQDDMDAVDTRIRDLSPIWKRDWGVIVEPFDRRLVAEGFRRSIYVALGAVALVLLIACANVANMLLAKGVDRTKEMAVRAALGAGRGRLITQLLTETMVLCLVGALAGVAVASTLVTVGRPFLADTLPFTAVVTLDLRVLAFAVALSVVACLLVGLLPSLRLSGGSLAPALHQSSRGSSSSREILRQGIVVGEVAVSVVLVGAALLLARSLLKLQDVDAGVRLNNVLTMSTDLPMAAYPTPDSAIRFYDAAQERLGSIPGVEEAAVGSALPLDGVHQGEAMLVPGYDEALSVRYKRVDSHYFGLFAIPVLAGRGITARDTIAAPRSVVVNEALAAQLVRRYELADPVGRTVRLSTPDYANGEGTLTDVQIVGIIRNERTQALDMVLGARSRDVIGRVLRQALSMIAVGVIVGLAATLVLTRALESLLFEVSALDPTALSLASLAVLLLGAFAGLLPASRAASVDPAIVLRADG